MKMAPASMHGQIPLTGRYDYSMHRSMRSISRWILNPYPVAEDTAIDPSAYLVHALRLSFNKTLKLSEGNSEYHGEILPLPRKRNRNLALISRTDIRAVFQGFNVHQSDTRGGEPRDFRRRIEIRRRTFRRLHDVFLLL